MVRACFRVKRIRQGRHTANSRIEAIASRCAATPGAPTLGNNPLASTAPSWKQAIAASNAAMGAAIG